MIVASINEQCSSVRMLLDHQADPNQKDIIGNTALHLGESAKARSTPIFFKYGLKYEAIANIIVHCIECTTGKWYVNLVTLVSLIRRKSRWSINCKGTQTAHLTKVYKQHI